ncbi:g12479 [Coccomyxa viridis]|uniref:HVA22-like protein n=1 Tax=Coccomyxa viridis TaxID=1274662 RepID=A0ABP1GAT0_9CHLO
MAALVPIAAEVGLQLLLQPASSSAVANAGCIAAGMVFPAYASCKALDGGSSTEKSHWLAYWIAFGGVSAVEAFLTRRFPGYYHLKLLLLLWLQSKRYQGAWRLYIEFIRPLYRKLKPKADAALTQAASVLDNREVRSASEHVHSALTKVPILEWFLRDPVDESSLERFFSRLLG